MKLICCDAAAFEQQIVGDGKNKDALQQNKNNPPAGSSTPASPPPHTHTQTSSISHDKQHKDRLNTVIFTVTVAGRGRNKSRLVSEVCCVVVSCEQRPGVLTM